MNVDNMLNMYDAIKDKRINRDAHIEEVQRIDKEIEHDILEYRIESVKRVLAYISSKLIYKDGFADDLDIYVTHCINKLSGNCDGVELELDGKND